MPTKYEGWKGGGANYSRTDIFVLTTQKSREVKYKLFDVQVTALVFILILIKKIHFRKKHTIFLSNDCNLF